MWYSIFFAVVYVNELSDCLNKSGIGGSMNGTVINHMLYADDIYDQLSHYLETNYLLCPQQYGFTKNSSTELAALEVIDRLLNQLNKHKIPINLYLDLAKAFDSLNHGIFWIS